MTSSPKRKEEIFTKPPPPPLRQLGALTSTERWYLECFRLLTNHLKRPPSILEFSEYVRRTKTPCHIALSSCASKGYLNRTGRGGLRRFVFPKQAKLESTGIPSAGVAVKR